MEPVVRRRGLGDELGEEEQTEGARALVGRRLSDDPSRDRAWTTVVEPRRIAAGVDAIADDLWPIQRELNGGRVG